MIRRLVSIILITFSVHSYGQETILNCSDSTFCIPSVVGLPRSKGLVIKRELLKDYRIISNSNQPYGNSEAQIQRNRRWEMKLRLPVVMKQGFKMAAGIKYFVEEFNFENINSTEYPFYKNLEDRPLRSLSADVFMVKPTLTKRYYLLRISAGLNGDYNSESFGKDDFFKFSISPLVGWKKNDFTSYAVGVAFSYSLGRQSIFPIFAYNRSFNNQWGIESILPVNVKLRYSTLNQKNYFYLKSELNGTNYSIRLGNGFEDLVFLSKSEVRFLLNWEREIHDWLWFGIEAGLRKNIDFNLLDSQKRNADIIIDNDLNESIIYSFSLFIVPPRKFLK